MSGRQSKLASMTRRLLSSVEYLLYTDNKPPLFLFFTHHHRRACIVPSLFVCVCVCWS